MPISWRKKTKQKENVSSHFFRFFSLFGYCIVGIVLVSNIVVSQTVPPLYFRLIAGDKGALVEFFKWAKALPQFNSLLPEIKNTVLAYQPDIDKEHRERIEKISSLKETLKLNPRSRDILYALFLLYQADGQWETASWYLQQARLVDPAVGK